MKKLLNIFIAITCVLISIYFGIKIYKELTPKSYKEQQLDCLKMGSDDARLKCLNIINGNQSAGMNSSSDGKYKDYVDTISKFQQPTTRLKK